MSNSSMRSSSCLIKHIRSVWSSLARLSDQKTTKEISYQAWLAADGDRTLRVTYALSKEDVVLDVGGYEGQWASDMFARYCCRIHVFEAVPAYAEAMAARFVANPSIKIHAFALGSTDAHLNLSVDGNASSAFTATGKQITVPMKEFATWFKNSGLREIALMKINIEGGEFELLPHLIDTGLIRNILNIQVQFHDFIPNAVTRMTGILAKLSDTHSPTYQFPFIWENWVRKDPPPQR